MSLLQIETIGNIQVIASTVVATELGVEHRATLQLIEKYLPEIESRFGRVAFEMLPFETAGGTQKVKVAYLTEDQAIFICTLSRNTEQVVQFKANLVQSFQAAKRLVEQVLPKSKEEIIAEGYHLALQDAERMKEQNRLLTQTINQQAPMVAYFNEVIESNGSHTTTIIAQDFGLSAVMLNRKLKEAGVIRRVDGEWALCAKYLGKGYTDTKTHTYTDSKGNKQTSIQLRWTEKGRELLHSVVFPKKVEKPADLKAVS